MNKKLISFGIIAFALAILFGLLFTWTLEVHTTAWYVNIYGVGNVVRDFDSLREEPKIVFGVLSIILIIVGIILTLLGVNHKESK